MATINYVDEAYINAYIGEILTNLKTWIDTDKNIALKKVLYKDNSLMFFKNPNAIETDIPEFEIDLPAERFLDQTKTVLVENFIWSEIDYPGTTNPNIDGNPVLVLAVKGEDDTISYSFLNMKLLLNVYQPSAESGTVTITIDINTNTIGAEVNISSDVNNRLGVGSDGGLYCPATDLSELVNQIQALQTLCSELSDRITILENSSGENSASEDTSGTETILS